MEYRDVVVDIPNRAGVYWQEKVQRRVSPVNELVRKTALSL